MPEVSAYKTVPTHYITTLQVLTLQKVHTVREYILLKLYEDRQASKKEVKHNWVIDSINRSASIFSFSFSSYSFGNDHKQLTVLR